MNNTVNIGTSDNGSVGILLSRANRHGFVAGATGTGKTVTLQRTAEQFARAGVPVFMADIKGDLSGIAQPKTGPAVPVRFWDVYGNTGEHISIRVAQMGPTLLARLMQLTESQEAMLMIAFQIAVKNRRPLDTLQHLQSILIWMGENADSVSGEYGRVTPQSIGTLQRKVMMLRQEADVMFGPCTLKIEDLMEVRNGQGVVSLLDATYLVQNSSMYTCFLMWLMTEMFNRLPEVGDMDKPKLVFFFDEAHLLFQDAPKPLLDKIEQVVRLIRSKGVGIYFVTQKPSDIPDKVLAQLSNRVQHALRAYTPAEQKGLKAVAQSFRVPTDFDTAAIVQGLKVGQALVSTLDVDGVPQMAQITKVALPESKLGPCEASFKPRFKPNKTQAAKSQVSQSKPVKIDYKRVQKTINTVRKVHRGGLLALVFNR